MLKLFTYIIKGVEKSENSGFLHTTSHFD